MRAHDFPISAWANTKRVNKADLPKTWEELLTNPRWHNGTLGLSNSPASWLLSLWGVKGEKWAKDYMTRLFTKVRPQLRKEGQNASMGLVAIGEFDAVIPASTRRALEYQKRGAPVGFHCPTPVPAGVTQLVILRGNPYPNATRQFTH